MTVKAAPSLLSVTQAAERHGITRRALRWAITTGALPATKIPGRTSPYLLDADEVAAWANLRSTECPGCYDSACPGPPGRLPIPPTG